MRLETSEYKNINTVPSELCIRKLPNQENIRYGNNIEPFKCALIQSNMLLLFISVSFE